MKMTANDIVERVRFQLHDLRDQRGNALVSNYRWPDTELLLYINDGMREVCRRLYGGAKMQMDVQEARTEYVERQKRLDLIRKDWTKQQAIYQAWMMEFRNRERVRYDRMGKVQAVLPEGRV